MDTRMRGAFDKWLATKSISELAGVDSSYASEIAEWALEYMSAQQEPALYVHPMNLQNPALGILCSPVQLSTAQIGLYTNPVPPSVSEEIKAQPLYPDEGREEQFQHEKYRQGWNDCRAAMLAAALKQGEE